MSALLKKMTVEELVERFTEIALAQDKAVLEENYAHFNKLYGHMDDVKTELKDREGDQRRALLRLYRHSNPQVRLKAVKATLAVVPDEAQAMLRVIANSRENPQAGEAGMSIRAMERGIFKPT